MLAAFCVLASLAQGQGPVHYRVESQTVASIDLTAMGQGVQNQTMTSMALLTTTMTDTTGGRLAHVVIDSITFDGGAAEAQMPPDMLKSAKGGYFHAYVVNGKPTNPPVASITSVAATQVAAGVALMFPGARPGLKVGDSWTDSTNADTTATGGASVKGHTITHWAVTAVDNGVISLDGTTVSNGVIGGAAQMEIQSNGKQSASSIAGGPGNGGLATSEGQTTMNMAGNAIPIRVTTTVKLTKLP